MLDESELYIFYGFTVCELSFLQAKISFARDCAKPWDECLQNYRDHLSSCPIVTSAVIRISRWNIVRVHRASTLQPGKKKEILITFGEEDKSLIIHAKRGSLDRAEGLSSLCVHTRSDLRGVCVVPQYVGIYLISTYRERDKSRGVRWTMVIS